MCGNHMGQHMRREGKRTPARAGRRRRREVSSSGVSHLGGGALRRRRGGLPSLRSAAPPASRASTRPEASAAAAAAASAPQAASRAPEHPFALLRPPKRGVLRLAPGKHVHPSPLLRSSCAWRSCRLCSFCDCSHSSCSTACIATRESACTLSRPRDLPTEPSAR